MTEQTQLVAEIVAAVAPFGDPELAKRNLLERMAACEIQVETPQALAWLRMMKRQTTASLAGGMNTLTQLERGAATLRRQRDEVVATNKALAFEHAELHEQFATLKAQRDELLKACKNVRAYIEPLFGMTQAALNQKYAILDELKAVIAAAR